MREPRDASDCRGSGRTKKTGPSAHRPVILLTAHTYRTPAVGARDAGVNACVAKPVSIDEMRRKIELVGRDPRRFIRAEDYVGPGRRRRDMPLAGRRDRRNPQE